MHPRGTDGEVVLAAAQAGADVVARAYGGPVHRRAKQGLDLVTDVDLAAERAILAVLAAARPDDAVEAEESGSSGATVSTRRWLVDPLCGTLNFAAHTPLVAVNVALTTEGATTAAAVVDPIAGEAFWTDGVEARVRTDGVDAPLKPSPKSRLVDVNCDGPLDRPFVGPQLLGDPRFRASFGPRVVSSTLAVAWTAAGRRSGYVSDGTITANVHFAAGIAVCRAAGCVVTDLAGGPVDGGRGLLIAADDVTHAALLELVRPHLEASSTASD